MGGEDQEFRLGTNLDELGCYPVAGVYCKKKFQTMKQLFSGDASCAESPHEYFCLHPATSL